MADRKPARMAKTRALEAIRILSTKSKRPMKTTKPNAKAKVMKKLSGDESEVKAAKVNSKLATKQTLQDISNITNTLPNPNSKEIPIQVNGQSVGTQKSTKSKKLAAVNQFTSELMIIDHRNHSPNIPRKLLDMPKQSHHQITSSIDSVIKLTTESPTANTSSSLISPSFVPTENSTPLPSPLKATNASVNSDLFFTISDSSACIENDTVNSPAESSNKQRKAYSFGMIDTDDSTDDEEDVALKPDKRPPPPNWSLPVNRTKTIKRQSEVFMNVIDKFFGDAPDVDLLEIFPNIPIKLLTRRDSSFVWRTPTRYSVLPKY